MTLNPGTPAWRRDSYTVPSLPLPPTLLIVEYPLIPISCMSFSNSLTIESRAMIISIFMFGLRLLLIQFSCTQRRGYAKGVPKNHRDVVDRMRLLHRSIHFRHISGNSIDDA